jgi:hypothetical protein
MIIKKKINKPNLLQEGKNDIIEVSGIDLGRKRRTGGGVDLLEKKRDVGGLVGEPLGSLREEGGRRGKGRRGKEEEEGRRVRERGRRRRKRKRKEKEEEGGEEEGRRGREGG